MDDDTAMNDEEEGFIPSDETAITSAGGNLLPRDMIVEKTSCRVDDKARYNVELNEDS